MQLFFNILTCINTFCLLLFSICKLLMLNKLSNVKGLDLSNIDLDMWSDIGVIKNEKKD